MVAVDFNEKAGFVFGKKQDSPREGGRGRKDDV
jgi:hypothetical protein